MTKSWTISLGSIAACLSQSASAHATLEDVCGECIVEKVAECGGFLEGATVSADGALWVMDVTGDRVLEIRDGECINRGSGGGFPNGAKFRSDGNLLIANQLGLVAFAPDTEEITEIFTQYDGEALVSPNDLAVDGDGGVYLTEVRGSSLFNPVGRVYYIPADGGEVSIVADNLAFPNGIALAGNGREVLVSEFATKRIVSLPTVSSSVGFGLAYVFAQTAGGIGADGIHVDGNGRLYTAQLGGGVVQVFAADSRPFGEISFPDSAGMMVTNFVEADGYLYITEAQKGEIWRVKLNP